VSVLVTGGAGYIGSVTVDAIVPRPVDEDGIGACIGFAGKIAGGESLGNPAAWR
jgi:UDP-glucose 4-epimerase